MINCGRVTIGIVCFLALLLSPVNAQIPDSVFNTQDGAVYIFTVVDGNIDVYYNEIGSMS